MPPLDQLPDAYRALVRERDQLKDELALARWQLERLNKHLFGAGKSERLDLVQLPLELGAVAAPAPTAATPTTITYERTAPTAERRPAPEALFAKLPVREEVVIEPPEVKTAPEACERIGEERTFEVEIVPPRLFKRVIVRPKYCAKADRTLPPLLAPAPARIAAGGYASAGLIAWVAVAKYLDHLPLFRQEKQLARWGAPIGRSTLCDWIRLAAEALEPVYRTMLRELREGDYVQADETPVKCQDPDQPGLGIFQGYLWVLSRPGGEVCFDWRTSRRHGEATRLLGEFAGVLQSDGYQAYDAHAAERPAVIRVGCWAHARRKLVEAQADDPRAVRTLLRFIGWLYHREALWDAADDAARRVRDVGERARLRQRHFGRGLRWLHAWIEKLRAAVRPKSPLGEATGYLLAQWQPLTRHLEHGQTRLDNNLVENAIRPTALGRKNWLFIGGPEAGQRTAILYSLIVSCLRHGKEPTAYLRDLLTPLPAMTNRDDLAALTPRRWQPAAPAAN